MAGDERWYFTKEQLLSPQTNPTQKCGIDADKELSYRQQAANFIQDMGQRLKVTQLCINTAIVYMHRFYMFHSFSKFHRNAISSCALFLAAKVEEQPRKLEHVINVAHKCLHRDVPALDTKSEAYLEQAHELVVNENIMLQTLGFDIAIEHPHTYVVKCCQLVRASKDLAQTSYFMATNSLHLTTMCLQYRPTFVACVCIHLACKWSSWEIPKSSEGKEWFWYVDKSVTSELLEELTSEFLAILDKCPSKLKRKMSLAKELLPEEKKTKVGTSQPSSKEVIKQNHVNSQQSSKSHQLRLPSPKKQIKKSPGQPSVNGKENPDHSFHLQVTSVPTLSSSPSENISPSKKIKPEGSVTISLAAYREMKEKRDKERQSQQDDVRKQVGASGSEEKKGGKPQAHNAHKKGSQNIRSSEGISESYGTENSERKKSEIVSALLNELSDGEQNSQQSNDFIRKPESLPHPRMPKDPSQSFTAVSTKHQDVLELPRPQTVNSDDLVKSFNENSKESSTKLVIKSNRDQKHPPSLVQKSTENSYKISGSNKSSRTNKHAKIKISKKPHQHSVSEVSQDKTLNSNRKRKSPHLETLPQASVNTNAVSRQSENGANGDGCKSAKISTSGDLTVNPKHKHKHAVKEKSSKSVLEHQNTSIPSPSLKMKIPKEKIKINQHNQDSSSKSSTQHREDLKIKINQHNPDSSSKSNTQHREDLKIKINQHNPDSSSKSNTQHREDLKIKINQHNPDSSSKSTLQHREDLKIKIPKLKLGVAESSKSSVIPPESSASSGSSLKLVISKERINSGTYSKSSSKPEKESRKRERSPKDSTLNKSPKQSKLECHATSSQKAGQSQEANSVSNVHPLGKQGYNQNTSGHPGVSHGHHRTDGMGGMFQGKRMAQPRPPPPPQYMMNYGTPQGFPYPQYYPYTLHVPIPMANYHHQAFPQLFGNPPPPPPPQDPPLPREPPPPSPPPPPPPE